MDSQLVILAKTIDKLDAKINALTTIIGPRGRPGRVVQSNGFDRFVDNIPDTIQISTNTVQFVMFGENYRIPRRAIYAIDLILNIDTAAIGLAEFLAEFAIVEANRDFTNETIITSIETTITNTTPQVRLQVPAYPGSANKIIYATYKNFSEIGLINSAAFSGREIALY